MKKLLAILLCLSMAFCMFGCGQSENSGDEAQAEAFTAIPLGGSLGDLELLKPSGGDEYVIVDTPEIYDAASDGGTTVTYYCEGSDIPYIMVYRWAKGEDTLESISEKVATEYAKTSYQMGTFPNGDKEYDCGYFNTIANDVEGLEAGCYYLDCNIIEDGDDFVEIDFLAATEEVLIDEELNQYLWIPKGYDADNNEKMKENGFVFFGEYGDSYYMPTICIAPYEQTYEVQKEAWSYYYPDGLPFTEAQYNNWLAAGWDENATEEYYKAVNIELTDVKKFEVNGAYIVKNSGTFNGKSVTDAYICFDNKAYNLWLETGFNPAPRYGSKILSTLHSK